MLSLLAKLLKVLNSETEPYQISLALCLALIAGFTPLFSAHNIVILLLVLILRINLSAFIAGTLFFTGAAYLFDPLFHKTGIALLSAEALKPTWTELYNNPFWRLIRFNNSVVAGSLLISMISFLPLYLLLNLLIRKYREKILEVVRKSRIMQGLKATKFYRIYERISYIRGGE